MKKRESQTHKKTRERKKERKKTSDASLSPLLPSPGAGGICDSCECRVMGDRTEQRRRRRPARAEHGGDIEIVVVVVVIIDTIDAGRSRDALSRLFWRGSVDASITRVSESSQGTSCYSIRAGRGAADPLFYFLF